MHALVTGGGGFAGSYLVKELLAQHHRVLSIGNGTAPPEQTDCYQQLDLMNAESLAALDLKKFDVIFHLAGLTNPGESFSQAAAYFQVNAGIQINLFEAALKQQAHPRWLVISSAHVYDSTAKPPWSETTAVSPTSPYAASKLAQEILARYYEIRGFEIIIGRAFNHIGPGQAPGFIVPDFAKRIAEAEKTNRPVIKVGNLEAKRDYTDVRDIVKAYVLLADKGEAGQTYNICSGKPTSGQEILDTLLGETEAEFKVEQDSQLMRPSDNPVIYGDNSKLSHRTGWTAEIPLKDTLKDTLDYWRQQAA